MLTVLNFQTQTHPQKHCTRTFMKKYYILEYKHMNNLNVIFISYNFFVAKEPFLWEKEFHLNVATFISPDIKFNFYSVLKKKIKKNKPNKKRENLVQYFFLSLKKWIYKCCICQHIQLKHTCILFEYTYIFVHKHFYVYMCIYK